MERCHDQFGHYKASGHERFILNLMGRHDRLLIEKAALEAEINALKARLAVSQ